jgi:hypothetical protein
MRKTVVEADLTLDVEVINYKDTDDGTGWLGRHGGSFDESCLMSQGTVARQARRRLLEETA